MKAAGTGAERSFRQAKARDRRRVFVINDTAAIIEMILGAEMVTLHVTSE